MKKYPKEFLEYATRAMELTKEDLEYMTRNEMLNAYLSHEGYGRHAGYFIRSVIKDICGIDLTNYREYLPPETIAEMDGEKMPGGML